MYMLFGLLLGLEPVIQFIYSITAEKMRKKIMVRSKITKVYRVYNAKEM